VSPTPRRATPWRRVRFAVVDLELTGLDPGRDELISFAAVPVAHGRVLVGETVAGLARPRSMPTRETIEIHGIRPHDLADAPPLDDAVGPLLAALRDAVPVAHAAWIEHGFLEPLARRHGMRVARPIDTADLWRLLAIERDGRDPGYQPLAEVCRQLGLPVHRPHEAVGDALTTAQAFIALVAHLDAVRPQTLGTLTTIRRSLATWRLFHRH